MFEKKDKDVEKLKVIIPQYQKELLSMLKDNNAVIIPIIGKYGLDIEIQMKEKPDLKKTYVRNKYVKDLAKLKPIINDGINTLNIKYGVILLPAFKQYRLNLEIIMQPKTDQSEQIKIKEK